MTPCVSLTAVCLLAVTSQIWASSPWRSVAGTGKPGFGGNTYEHNVSDFAVETRLRAPHGLALDAQLHRLYVADSLNHVIRSVDLHTGLLETLAGTGDAGYAGDGQAAPLALLNMPTGLVVDLLPAPSRVLYFSDTNNHRVRRVQLDVGQVYQAEAAQAVHLDGPETRLSCPDDDADSRGGGGLFHGSAYCEGSTGSGHVKYMHAVGGTVEFNVTASAGAGTYEARLRYSERYGRSQPGGAKRLRLYVNNLVLTHRLAFPATGAPQAGRTDVFAWVVVQVSLNAGTNTLRLEVTGQGGPRIDQLYLVPPRGAIDTVAGNGTVGQPSPDDAVSPQPASSSMLHSPQGLALDAAGQLLYIADAGNGRVRRLNLATGLISTVAGSRQHSSTRDGEQALGGKLFRPSGLVLDSAREYLYVADSLQNRVRRIDLTQRVTVGGTISTVAGVGMGHAPFQHMLRAPQGLALDEATTTLYLADRDTGRIRAVNLQDSTCHMEVVASLDCAYEGVSNTTCSDLGCCFDPHCYSVLNQDGRAVHGFTPEEVLTRVDGAALEPPISFVLGQRPRCCFPKLHRLADVEVLDAPSGIVIDTARRLLYVSQARTHRVLQLALDEGRCGAVGELC